MDVHGLLDISCDSLWFPVNNSETISVDWVSCGVAMLVDGGRGPKMFFEPVPKCSTRFSNVFLGKFK